MVVDPLGRQHLLDLGEQEVDFALHHLRRQLEVLADDVEHDVASRIERVDRSRLALWGYGGRLQSEAAHDLVSQWGGELDIPLEAMGLGIPPRQHLEAYFGLNEVVSRTSGSSAEARLFKKSAGTQARLCYMGHVIMENRNGLAVSVRLTQASGTAEREACLEMLSDTGPNGRITLGADKQYDVQAFVNILRSLKVTPHVAQNDTNRASAIDGRTTRHPGYAISISKRKRIEEVFGWLKTVGGLRKTRQRGTHRVGWTFTFSLAAYNLVRIRRLMTTG